MRRMAFSLLEVLTVVAIIGTLASIVTISGKAARERARDARRQEDISTIINALVLHEQLYGTLPALATQQSGVSVPGVNLSTAGPWLPTLVERRILSSVPRDPQNGAQLSWNAEQSDRAYAQGFAPCLQTPSPGLSPTVGGDGAGGAVGGGGGSGKQACPTPTPEPSIEPYVGQDRYGYAAYAPDAAGLTDLFRAADIRIAVCTILERDLRQTLGNGIPELISDELLQLGFNPNALCRTL